METGKIDGAPTTTSTKKQLADRNDENSHNTNTSSFDCKESIAKGLTLTAASIQMFTWNGIKFKLHGFLVAMVVIDVALSMFKHLPLFWKWAPYTLFKNALLFVTVMICCFIRIKLFGSNTSQQELEEEDEEKQEIEETDGIEFKSVIISYLGGLITLRKMTNKIWKQIIYFGFPVVFHGVLAITCFVFGVTCNGKGDVIDAKNLWIDLRYKNFYCMIMCLLPVPGFDGGALLTLYLKHCKWSKFMITLTLIFTSAVITMVCGLLGIFGMDIVAIYLFIFCGLKLFQYAFNPKDENMKVLRAMAKTTKTMSQTELV